MDIDKQITYLKSLLSIQGGGIISQVIDLKFDWAVEVESIREEISEITAKLNLDLFEGQSSIENNPSREEVSLELIEKLKILVKLISNEIVSSAYSKNSEILSWYKKAENLRKELSELASNLTLFIQGYDIPEKLMEENDLAKYTQLKILTGELGNLVFGFTQVVDKVEYLENQLKEVIILCNPLMDKITVFMNTYKLHKEDESTTKKVIEFLGNADFKLNKTLNILDEYKKVAMDVHGQSIYISELLKSVQKEAEKINILYNKE